MIGRSSRELLRTNLSTKTVYRPERILRNRSALLSPRHVACRLLFVAGPEVRRLLFDSRHTQKGPQKPAVQVWNWLRYWVLRFVVSLCALPDSEVPSHHHPISPSNAPFELSSSFLAECGICIVPKLLCHCAAVSFLFTSPPPPPTMETAHCANHVYCANHATLRDRRRAREPIGCARARSQTGFPVRVPLDPKWQDPYPATHTHTHLQNKNVCSKK